LRGGTLAAAATTTAATRLASAWLRCAVAIRTITVAERRAIAVIRSESVVVLMATVAAVTVAETAAVEPAGGRPLMHREFGNGTRRRLAAFDFRKRRADQSPVGSPPV
jgi:hypothetical protein